MVKHTETIRRQFAGELFKCDQFVGLALKGLKDLSMLYHATIIRTVGITVSWIKVNES